MPKPYPTLPEGTRIYAVGDIHGRLDLLETMGKAIESDLTKRPIADPVTVFLGDYIDRGPDSQASSISSSTTTTARPARSA